MSVFEKKIASKINLDDTDILIPNIINSEFTDGHTEYVIKVEKASFTEKRWFLHRRYNEFLCLHQSLQTAGVSLTFPPKKYIGNLDRKFISERQAALQAYLDEIVRNPFISSSLVVKQFLDPANYKDNSEVSSANELQIAVRNEMEIKFIKLLPQLGWRFRKKSYIIACKENSKKEYLLQWVPFGPDKHLEDEELCVILKSLTSLQHVNIAKIEKVGINRGAGWVLHDVKSGTLLDMVYEVKDHLNTCSLKKYGNNLRKPLNSTEVIEICSQILQALAFLHHKEIPYGHLHLGNILLEGNLVKLYGIENSLFGLPCFYRNALINLKAIDTIQAVDVYCFGLSLYEMLFVTPFDFTTKEISGDCPTPLRDVLESILSLRGLKNGLPSVKDLLNLKIFRRPPPNPQPYLRITQSGRANLDIAANKIIIRIKEDYSRVREQKKAKTMKKILENDTLPSFSRSS